MGLLGGATQPLHGRLIHLDLAFALQTLADLVGGLRQKLADGEKFSLEATYRLKRFEPDKKFRSKAKDLCQPRNVRTAFGNVGTLVSFRIGNTDAKGNQ